MSDETEIAPERAAELLRDGAQAVDVREDYEFEIGHIEAARQIELTRLTDQAESLDRSAPVVLYCRSGERSGMAADALRASGWDAYNVSGGLLAWREQGLPLEPADGAVAERRPGTA